VVYVKVIIYHSQSSTKLWRLPIGKSWEWSHCHSDWVCDLPMQGGKHHMNYLSFKHYVGLHYVMDSATGWTLGPTLGWLTADPTTLFSFHGPDHGLDLGLGLV